MSNKKDLCFIEVKMLIVEYVHSNWNQISTELTGWKQLLESANLLLGSRA
jgi:hypothetical protein